MRKIIQISQSACANTEQTQCDWILHALCDDGTLWAMTNNSDFGQVDTSMLIRLTPTGTTYGHD